MKKTNILFTTKYFSILILISCFTLYTSATTITFSANSMKGKTGSKSESTTLNGNAWIKTDDIDIKADTIELSGEDFRNINANGNVVGDSSKDGFTFTCDSLRYDRQTEIIYLEGNVVLNDTQNDVIAKAQFIEYDQKTEIALMQIGVELKQKDSVSTAALAVYRKAQQILEMTGSPKIVQKDDTFKAQEITFNLKTEEITLDGRVRGTVTDNRSKETEEPKSE